MLYVFEINREFNQCKDEIEFFNLSFLYCFGGSYQLISYKVQMFDWRCFIFVNLNFKRGVELFQEVGVFIKYDF